MASTDENPGLLARFYGSRQESSTRRKSAERPFPHNVQRGSTTAANCLYPDTTRGRRNVGRAAETLMAVTFYVFVFFWMFGIDAGR